MCCFVLVTVVMETVVVGVVTAVVDTVTLVGTEVTSGLVSRETRQSQGTLTVSDVSLVVEGLSGTVSMGF